MKVTILFENDMETEGDQTKVLLQEEGIEDVYHLMNFITKSVRAAGFDYWDRTGYSTDKGEITWEYPF